MVDDIVEVLEACFEEHRSVELHRLLYAVDARQHAIPNLDEINAALSRVGAGLRRGDVVPCVSVEAEPGACVELLDFAKAVLAYRATWGRKPVFRAPGKSID